MEENGKKKDGINVLCKKYFTPELCVEPVTESKRTLELKIYKQMLKYGQKLSSNYSDLTDKDSEDAIIKAISSCFEIWKKAPPEKGYTAYYATALKNEFNEMNKSASERKKEKSLEDPVGDGEEKTTFGDFIEDTSGNLTPEQYVMEKDSVKNIFTVIDRVFRLKKRSDWLKTGITGELYDELHAFYDRYPEEHIGRLSFVDVEIYNWKEKPTQKAVATYLGKDPGQMNKAVKKFLVTVRENFDVMS